MKKIEELYKNTNGNHLVEASAGTGKTYNIAKLALHLILVDQIPVQKLLLITFTNKATNEIKERVIKFLLDAKKYYENNQKETIEDAIAETVELAQATNKDINKSITDAIINIDECQISTIHSFCIHTLNNNKIVTGINYNQKIDDTKANQILNEILEDYFRRTVNKKYLETLKLLKIEGKSQFKNLIQHLLTGHELVVNTDNKYEEFYSFIEKSFQQIKKEYLKKLSQNQALDYDSSIKIVNQNIHQLKNYLRDQYHAVFVDEFQDTDEEQLNIIQQAFLSFEKTRVFLIGDPKQSIYKFRGADVNAYIKAKNIDGLNIYGMNKNFRSSNSYVEACNKLFKKEEGFHAFSGEEINYQEVSANKSDPPSLYEKVKPIEYVNESLSMERFTLLAIQNLLSKGIEIGKQPLHYGHLCVLVKRNETVSKIKKSLTKENIPVRAYYSDQSIFDSAEKEIIVALLEAILQPSASNIKRLLISDLFQLSIDEVQKKDLNSIVNSLKKLEYYWNENGLLPMFELFLNTYNLIPSAKQAEATEKWSRIANLRQLVEAAQDNATNKLFNPNKTLEWLKNNEEQHEYQQQIENDERAVKIMTIHKSKGLEFDFVILPELEELKFKLTYHRRIITTKTEEAKKVFIYHSKENLKKEFKEEYDTLRATYEKAEHEENLRLIYVAFTRAKFYAIFNNFSTKNRSFNNYQVKLEKLHQVNVKELKENIAQLTNTKIREAQKERLEKALPQEEFKDHQLKAFSYSSLQLKSKKDKLEMKAVDHSSIFDSFIFQMLPKGKRTGNFIHDILEKIDFTEDEHSWMKSIRFFTKRYFNQQTNSDAFLNHISEWIKHIVEAQISTGKEKFSLIGIDKPSRTSELEFFMPLQDDATTLSIDENHFTKPIHLKNYKQLKGLFTGFVDLFFIHNDKYYIVDWKSNFLGNELIHYQNQNLEDAMTSNNYHLQYYFYSLACHHYLQQHLGSSYNYEDDFGGVAYYFLRGNRSNTTSGIYFYKPSIDEIEHLRKSLFIKVND